MVVIQSVIFRYLQVDECFIGLARDAEGSKYEALQSYEETLESVTSIPVTVASLPLCQYWSKRYYEAYCKIAYQCHDSAFHSSADSQNPLSSERVLTPFRAWSTYLKSQNRSSSITSAAQASTGPGERQTWNAYYTTFSCMLQTGLLPKNQHQPGGRTSIDSADMDEESSTEAKLRLLKEMKDIERSYEALLLSEVSFPEAGVINTEVESWADQVMQNWRMLCGPAWADVIGPKEKATSGRNVLAVRILL